MTLVALTRVINLTRLANLVFGLALLSLPEESRRIVFANNFILLALAYSLTTGRVAFKLLLIVDYLFLLAHSVLAIEAETEFF